MFIFEEFVHFVEVVGSVGMTLFIIYPNYLSTTYHIGHDVSSFSVAIVHSGFLSLFLVTLAGSVCHIHLTVRLWLVLKGRLRSEPFQVGRDLQIKVKTLKTNPPPQSDTNMAGETDQTVDYISQTTHRLGVRTGKQSLFILPLFCQQPNKVPRVSTSFS